MSTFWIVVLVIVGIFVLLSIFRKPIVIEGRVIEKNIAQNVDEDSYLSVEMPTKQKVVLKFDTHSVGFLLQIGGESFHNRAEELARAIDLNDEVKVETFNRDGLTRDVYKLLSVAKAS